MSSDKIAVLVFNGNEYNLATVLATLPTAPVIELVGSDVISADDPELGHLAQFTFKNNTMDLDRVGAVFMKHDGRYIQFFGVPVSRSGSVCKGKLITSVGLKKAKIVEEFEAQSVETEVPRKGTNPNRRFNHRPSYREDYSPQY